MNLKNTVLGIELGSTRIKAVLVDKNYQPIASGSYEWENQLVNQIWTYSLAAVKEGVQSCFADLKAQVFSKFGTELTTVGAIGVSAMMHGYLPFDAEGNQLAEFRTWRNTMTGPAAEKLTNLFSFNIPQRWSIAHLYQAILNQEEHVTRIDTLTTLAGYLHWILTGVKALGIGEASGMFPIDSDAGTYDEAMMAQFDQISGCPWKLKDILPKVLSAGDDAGCLTEAGALYLDPTGTLQPGIPFAPCEGDAGTGMTATNSIKPGTGNVSAGTSDFAMLVTDRMLNVHREIDMVTTPSGMPVAMVHCNNCTSDINAWVGLLLQFADAIGASVKKEDVFPLLFRKSLQADPDAGGLLSYNYFSGEGVTDIDAGRPVFARLPDAKFTLENFMRAHIFSALATLKIGMDILTHVEKVPIEKLYGHGGFFKTPEVGQKILSAAVEAPVSVMKTAGEGGPYGMALLAAYRIWREDDETLESYLENKVFASAETVTVSANDEDIQGFNKFVERYQNAFSIERTAVEKFN